MKICKPTQTAVSAIVVINDYVLNFVEFIGGLVLVHS